MRFRHLAALVALAIPASALAHGPERHPGPDMRPVWKEDGHGYDAGPRGVWLDDCRRRIADYRSGLGGGPDNGDESRDLMTCETYFDQHFAGGAGYGYAPIIMVPITVSPRNCVETVTTDYVDRPARRAIPRRAPRPDKRIRIAPDKRVPIE